MKTNQSPYAQEQRGFSHFSMLGGSWVTREDFRYPTLWDLKIAKFEIHPNLVLPNLALKKLPVSYIHKSLLFLIKVLLNDGMEQQSEFCRTKPGVLRGGIDMKLEFMKKDKNKERHFILSLDSRFLIALGSLITTVIAVIIR